MELRYSTQARGEKVVCAIRLLLASFVAASFLVGSTPERAGDFALYPATLLYLTWAAAACVLAFHSPRLFWSRFSHGVDVLFFGLNLLATTQSPVSPNVSALFPVLAACLRFSWKTALLTSITLLTIYYTAFSIDQSGAAFDAGHFSVRAVGYALISAMAIYLRSREENMEAEVSSLASWPHDYSESVPIRDLLGRAAEVLRSPRVVLTWEEQDEPWLHIAWKSGDDVHWVREAPARYEPLVHPELETCNFLVHDTAAGASLVHRKSGVTEWRGTPFNVDFVREFKVRSALALHLDGSMFSGRLLALERRGLTTDDMMFGELVSRFVVSRLDQFLLLQRAQSLAVGEERMRLSRDLHDGVLQSLTGAALQIEAVRGLLIRDPAAADQRLGDVQAVLASDQRELRSFIRQLRPTKGASPMESRLTARLSDLAGRFSKQWGLKVDMNLDGLIHLMSDAVKHEVVSLVSEAVANAAKHASATTIRVEIQTSADAVQITVTDDGCGFPFEGRLTLGELNELKRGPVILKERVTSLGGDLVIVSTRAGAALDITIPYH